MTCGREWRCCRFGCSARSESFLTRRLTQAPHDTESKHNAASEAYSSPSIAGHAVLVGQSEPDVSGRSPRQLHVVAEAEREWSPQPVLREHARGVAGRCRVLVLRHA